MNTVLWILYIVLAVGCLVQGVRAEMYKRRAEDAEWRLETVAERLKEIVSRHERRKEDGDDVR